MIRAAGKLACLLVCGLLLAGCRPQHTVTWQVDGPTATLSVAGVRQIAEPTWRVVGQQVRYRLPLPGARLSGETPAPKVPGGKVELERDAVALTLPWQFAARAELNGTTARLILTVGGETRRESPVDAGLTLSTLERAAIDGPTRLVALRLAPDQAYRLRLGTAARTVCAKTTVASIAREQVAAINGGFFDPETGAPLGALRIDGEWISPPIRNRGCLVLPPGRRPWIAPLAWRAEVQTPLAELPIDSLNHTPDEDAVCAVTTRWWDGAAEFAGLLRTTLPGGVTVHHRQSLDAAPVLVWRTEPAADGDVLGGGPVLLREGQVVATQAAAEEGFKSDFTEAVVARSGVGLLADGGVVLAVGEGRAPYSRGFTLAQWAEALRALGCVDALNLDGSLSSTLVLGGHVQGHPAGGAPGSVANALVVVGP